MEHAFTDVGLTQRDQAFMLFVSQVALHAEGSDSVIKSAGFNDRQIDAIRGAVARLEQDLSKNNSTLSTLLAKTLKSSCCR